MKNRFIIFVLGLTLGAGAVAILGSGAVIKNDVEYVQLKKDYKIEGAGYLTKGTTVRIDQHMEEGFTRYILYLNLNDGEFTEAYLNKYDIIPYWLMPTDTTK